MKIAKRVLVVEDNRDWREDLISMLQDENYDVDYASTFHHAREWLRQRTYAVITVDLNLDEGAEDTGRNMKKHGELILRYIQRNNEVTRCIVVSGSVMTQRDVRDLLKQKGAWDYISKAEFDYHDFLVMVHDAMEDSVKHQEDLLAASGGSSADDAMMDQKADLALLRELLNTHFDIHELDSICFGLAIDYENLTGETKIKKCEALLKLMNRSNRLPELVTECKQLRPGTRWDTITV